MMAKVGCAGLLVADTFCGPLPELPREGQLLAVEAMTSSAGGCAANVALDLARQGVAVELAGCVGRDSAAVVLLEACESAGVQCERVVSVASYPTSQTFILLVEGQDRRYIHLFGSNAALKAEHLDRDWLRTLDVFYLGGLFALPGLDISELGAALAFCREHGVITMLDVVVPQDAELACASLQHLLPHADYFLPNDDEARHLSGFSDPLSQLQAFRKMGARTVILTRGRMGAMAAQGDRYWQAAAYEMEAVDPSGSGDAFASGVIYGVLRNWPLPQILRYATAVGGSATRSIGTTRSVFGADEAQQHVIAHPLQVLQMEAVPESVSLLA